MIREKYDIVDCQQFPYLPCFPVKLAAAIKKEPLIITWHEVWGDYWYEYLGWKGALGKGIERLVSLLTPHAVSVSETTEQNLRRLGVSRPIPVIPNGIDLNHLKSVPPHKEQSDLIFVGRLIKEKHTDILVRAFASLRPEYPDLILVIIGDGPEKETIRSLIADLSAGDRIFLKPFTESHDEVIGRMKSSRVCVIPSTREGFGIAALEALACGLPVITVNHPGNAIRELLSEKTGFICPLSEENIADAIRVALKRYPEMRAACMESAEPFDWDRIADMLEDYYRDVGSGS
jgi:glycosyltransferase involved in cell wall biosynthesis